VPKDWFAEEGAGTFSLMFAIACLVISCPCALGLATPTVSQIRKYHFQEVQCTWTIESRGFLLLLFIL
jgi:hypothetical protein